MGRALLTSPRLVRTRQTRPFASRSPDSTASRRGPRRGWWGGSEEGPRSDLRGGISEACRTGQMPPRRGRQRRPAPAHPPVGRQWPTAIRYGAELNEITVTNVSAPGVSVSPIDYRGPGSVPDQQFPPQAIHHARDQELTWAQLGELLNTTAAPAARATGTSHDQLDRDHRHNAAQGAPGQAGSQRPGRSYPAPTGTSPAGDPQTSWRG